MRLPRCWDCPRKALCDASARSSSYQASIFDSSSPQEQADLRLSKRSLKPRTKLHQLADSPASPFARARFHKYLAVGRAGASKLYSRGRVSKAPV